MKSDELVNKNASKSDDFLEMLDWYKLKTGESDDIVAGKLGCDRNYPSKIRTGRRNAGRVLRLKLKELCKLIGDWPPPVQKLEPASARYPRRVPLVSLARAGAGIAYEDLCAQMEEWVSTNSRDPNAFGLVVEGDSMHPRLMEGDYVVVEPNGAPRTGRLCVAKHKDGRILTKRFYRTGPEGKTVRLVSDNSAYSPIEAPDSEFEWIYPVAHFQGNS